MKVFIVLALALMGPKLSSAQAQGPDVVCTTGEAAIIFILDASGSVTAPHFAIQQQFASNVSLAFKVGPANTRFGALLYSFSADVIFTLDRFSTNQEVSQALLTAPYPQGSTNTHLGLNKAETMFQIARPSATKVAIVITDGKSENTILTAQAATDLKNSGVKILSIGVANAVESELLAIASQNDYMFEADSYTVIDTLKNDVIGKSCEATGGTPHPPCAGSLVGQECLTLNSQPMTQADAAASCAAKGESLVEIRTEEIFIALGKIAADNNQRLWAGAQEASEGDWRWVSDNTAAGFPSTWFSRGNPNNWGGQEDCLQMLPKAKLNDASCTKKFPFVCVK